MKSNQPYLLKAFFDWIVDNSLTPYIVVNATLPGVDVPTQYVKDGQIVLNISPNACVNFHMDLEFISFQARFGGQPMIVSLPCLAVGAIYAKENGAGTVFADAEELQQAYLEEQNAKQNASKAPFSVSSELSEQGEDVLVDKAKTSGESNKKGPPSLKVVK